jgi:hypothetical protein
MEGVVVPPASVVTSIDHVPVTFNGPLASAEAPAKSSTASSA